MVRLVRQAKDRRLLLAGLAVCLDRYEHDLKAGPAGHGPVRLLASGTGMKSKCADLARLAMALRTCLRSLCGPHPDQSHRGLSAAHVAFFRFSYLGSAPGSLPPARTPERR